MRAVEMKSWWNKRMEREKREIIEGERDRGGDEGKTERLDPGWFPFTDWLGEVICPSPTSRKTGLSHWWSVSIWGNTPKNWSTLAKPGGEVWSHIDTVYCAVETHTSFNTVCGDFLKLAKPAVNFQKNSASLEKKQKHICWVIGCWMGQQKHVF